jgi:hypothetical protein
MGRLILLLNRPDVPGWRTASAISRTWGAILGRSLGFPLENNPLSRPPVPDLVDLFLGFEVPLDPPKDLFGRHAVLDRLNDESLPRGKQLAIAHAELNALFFIGALNPPTIFPSTDRLWNLARELTDELIDLCVNELLHSGDLNHDVATPPLVLLGQDSGRPVGLAPS